MENQAITIKTSQLSRPNALTISVSINLIKYSAIILLGVAVGLFGYWLPALALTVALSFYVFADNLMKDMYNIDWLDDKADIKLEDIISDLETGY